MARRVWVPPPPLAGRAPTGFVDWRGYRMPTADHFRGDELFEVARLNHYRLTPPVLRKWAQWRLIPGPVGGGPTRHGRGKGQTWSIDAGRRVAWLARWKGAGETYDRLRLAMWPATAALDERLPDIVGSLGRWADAEEALHDLGVVENVVGSILHPYQNWSDGDAREEELRTLLNAAGVRDVDQQAQQLPFLRTETPEKILDTARRASDIDLLAFIRTFRQVLLQQQALFDEAVLNPRGLVRILARHLHRWRISQ